MIANIKVFKSWLWVVLCSIGIFLSVPVGREIQDYVSKNWGRSLFGYFVFAAVGAGFLGLLYVLIFKLKIRSYSRYFWLVVVAGLYGYFTFLLWDIPEEAVHFLEYGLLGFFLFKALSHDVKDKSIYLTGTLLALLIGTFDETFQWIIPDRSWDFRDVGLNGLSGGLFQLSVWKVVRPGFIKGFFTAKSLRIFSGALIGCALILGLCASNTPDRVYSYTEKISFLQPLRREEPMSEFGYKHKDPEIGVFYSRLSAEDLRKTDENMGREYGGILNRAREMKYRHFLDKFNPGSNAFLHEVRVHIFRRNRHFQKGKEASKEGKRKELLFVAYKEDLILKKYFKETIKNSVYWWGEEKVKMIKGEIDEQKNYESPVSSNLFTGFTEKGMWTGIFFLVFLLVLIHFLFPYIKRRQMNLIQSR